MTSRLFIAGASIVMLLLCGCQNVMVGQPAMQYSLTVGANAPDSMTAAGLHGGADRHGK